MTRTLDSQLPAAPARVRAGFGMHRDLPGLRRRDAIAPSRGIAVPH